MGAAVLGSKALFLKDNKNACFARTTQTFMDWGDATKANLCCEATDVLDLQELDSLNDKRL